MPKLKIKDFKGIFTNLDENDSNPEACRDSINFYHKRGFLEFNPRHLREFPTLPDTSPFVKSTGAQYTWTYETGIYTTLTSDRLTTDLESEPVSYNVLVLILKAIDAGMNHRLIYLWDGSTWTELSSYTSAKYGGMPYIDLVNYSQVDMPGVNNSGFHYSHMSTELTGDAFFQEEDGRLKVYLPHDAFWIGKLRRKIWINDGAQRWGQTVNSVTTYPYFNYETYSGWYIERLSANWKQTEQFVSGFTTTSSTWRHYQQVNNGAQFSNYTLLKTAQPDHTTGLSTKRRLGITYDWELNTDLTSIVDGEAITVGGPHDNVAKLDPWQNNTARCFRQNIISTDTGFPIKNPDNPLPGYVGIWTWGIDYDRTEAALGPDWTTNFNIGTANYTKVFICFTAGLSKVFYPASGDPWGVGEAPTYQAYSGTCKLYGLNNHTFTYAPITFSISMYDWINGSWEYGGDQEVQDVGYLASDKDFGLIATMVLDDREELPVAMNNFTVDPTGKYALKIKNIHIPWNISKRVTRLRFYHALKEGSDFEMVKEFDFLTDEGALEDFGFTNEQKNGETLAGNIGYLVDLWKRPNDLKIVIGFRSFVTESGISIGLSHRDLVGIYHSTFGGGNLMPDLIYDDNRLPISGVKKLTAVGNADGRLMAFTDNTAYAIETEEVSGIIGFRIEDTVEVGVKDQHDISNIQGGVAVHTIHGIYITNGYETKSISEAIDDIIVTNYSTGRIYYNRYKHYLYYKPTNAEDLYRYRFIDAVWERINKTTTSGEVEGEEIS